MAWILFVIWSFGQYLNIQYLISSSWFLYRLKDFTPFIGENKIGIIREYQGLRLAGFTDRNAIFFPAKEIIPPGNIAYINIAVSQQSQSITAYVTAYELW